MALEKLPETTATQETEKLLGSDWKKDLKEILLTPTHPERKSLIKETMVSSSVFHILMFSLPLIGLIFLPIVNGMGGLIAASLFVSWGLSPILHRLLFNSWF